MKNRVNERRYRTLRDMSLPDFRTQIGSQKSVAAAVCFYVDYCRAKNKSLTAIQVGACNGQIEDDPLQRTIETGSHVNYHLVEAVPWLFQDLVKAMAPYSGRVHCHQAVIAAKDKTRLFYSVSPSILDAEPAIAPWKLLQIGSLTDQYLKHHIPERFIVAEEINAVSPQTFMKNASISPEQLNLLMTDAEGFDGEIVGAFLEVSRPQIIVYEHKVMSSQANAVLSQRLSDLHYKNTIFGDDVLAWQ